MAFLFPKEDEWGDPWDNTWQDIPDWVTQVRITDDNRLVLRSAEADS